MHASDDKSESQASTPVPPSAPEREMYVVGVGASSGGLPALQTLLSTLPANPGFAIVIVVHLSPQHESHLSQLLQPHTPMPVQQVTATVALERDHVYVIPPNANLDTIDTHLRLTPLEERRRKRAPIDHFLRTLAATHDGTSIGVILTGAGSDGSIGLRHIKECGGLAIAQDPEDAEFGSMPRSAIATGLVDVVLQIRDIAAEIMQFCGTQPRLPSPEPNTSLSRDEAALLNAILARLREATRTDFGVYKRAVLFKRLRKRMQMLRVTTLSRYLDVLTRESQEAQALANEMLVLPTEFFRDAETFVALEQRVIPQIVARKNKGEATRIRVWSIGCSTGEEAYSLAMLLMEHGESWPHRLQPQVFASDVAQGALDTAREGIYPREIAASVSSERLERFFTPHAGFLRIKREVRDAVLFAAHDLFKDPPFSHIDLVVCRTLLSDLQPEVRHGVLSLLHYAIEPDGILVVGPHDEMDLPALFELEAGQTVIYRRIGASAKSPALPSFMQPFGPDGVRGTAHWTKPAAQSDIRTLYRSAVEHYAPPSVLVNDENKVVHFSTDVGKYVRLPGGELTHDLIRLVHESLRPWLVRGLHWVRQSSQPWTSKPLAVPVEHDTRRVVLRVERVVATSLILVAFDDHSELTSRRGVPREAANTIANLEAEVESLQRRLQSILDAQTQDLDADTMRAQLSDAAVELHSVLDELATSKEELQAVNEELITLDEENHRRVQELAQISNDLQHLLASTGIATLFLDRELNVVRFTPVLGEMFGLRLADIGRPVSDLARLVRYGEFTADAQRVLETLEPIDREVTDVAGHWYLSRVLPYRTEADRVEGVVLTLLDITGRKAAEQALQEASRRKDEFLAILAHELRNPLAPISAGIHVLKAAPGQREIVERISGTMERQTHQLVRLVDDLLEVSRISGGKLHLRTVALSLNEVIQDALSSVQTLVEQAGHQLSVNITSEPLLVEGDAVRLTQVLSNLLHNAVRYTPPPGAIAVSANREDGNVVVTIKDNGVGIPRNALEHVFEMFYQGRNARAEYGIGLGIGLTLAKTLVEMHGGTLSVASEGENQGSEFKMRLPLALAAAVTSPAPRSPDRLAPTPDRRILIVDDNVDAAETLCMLMKSLGERTVHTASSGALALQTSIELHPDIVLLDLAMPEMDGYEVARRMRNEPWGKNLLLVALSGWGHEEHRRRSKEAGFDRHVTKPADLATLREILNEWRPAQLTQPRLQ